MQKYNKSFFETFLIALCLCLSPFKALAFAIPFICVFWFLIRSMSAYGFKRLLLVIFMWSCILSFYSLFNALIESDFNISNGILSFLNYSSILSIIIFPLYLTSTEYNYEKYAKFLLRVLFFEGCWGVMQKALAPIILGSQSGDVVEGTINPFSFIQGHSGFSNQFFAINLVCLLIFCFPYIYLNKINTILYITGFLSLILASVGHVFYSFILAIIVTYLLFEGNKLFLNVKALILFPIAIFSILFIFATLDPKVWANTTIAFNDFVRGNTPKSRAVTIAMNDLGEEFPTMYLVGMGPGEYSSRAGIIASGDYSGLSNFFKAIPFLNISASDSYKKYVRIHWLHIQKVGARESTSWATSTMARPFFSLLSVFTEFGGITFVILFVVIFSQISTLKKKYKASKDISMKQIAFCCSTTILFLFFIGMYENYYETSQGIFVGILLILLMRSILLVETKRLENVNNGYQK